MADEHQVEQPEPGSIEVPEWVPEKFRSNPADFGKSYGELEAKLTQTTQQLRTQQEQLEEVLAKQNEEPEPQENFFQASQDQLQAAYEQDPVATMAWLAQQAAQSVFAAQTKDEKPDPYDERTKALLAAEYAQRQITAQYPDWETYRDEIQKEIDENPDLYPDALFKTPDGIEKALTRAYKAARLDALESNTNETLEQQIAAQRLAKQQAQTLSGATGRPAPTDSSEDRWAEIANAGTRSFRDIVSGT